MKMQESDVFHVKTTYLKILTICSLVKNKNKLTDYCMEFYNKIRSCADEVT